MENMGVVALKDIDSCKPPSSRMGFSVATIADGLPALLETPQGDIAP